MLDIWEKVITFLLSKKWAEPSPMEDYQNSKIFKE